MNICGIIAEYNPFHNGHLWQINQIKQQFQPDVLIIAMSGNFVQRGDFAIIDKWHRTQMALDAGADLVVELPIYAAVQPADIFAEEALRVLQELHVNQLIFGSEQPQLDYYKIGVQINRLAQNSKNFGDFHNTYATQFNQAIEQSLGFKVHSPNQLLGLAYAQACLKLDYPVKLTALPRHGQAEHDDQILKGKYSNASAIRKAILNHKDYHLTVPNSVFDLIEHSLLFSWEQFFPFLKYRLLTVSISELNQIYQMNEGLEYKFKQEILSANNLSDFLHQVKSKRYTYARLRRLALYTLLNITNSQMKLMRQQRYLHILGFNSRGQQHLHQVKKQINVPLVTKVTQKLGNSAGVMARCITADRILNLVDAPEQNFGHQPIRKQ